jgi:hypothetical protein
VWVDGFEEAEPAQPVAAPTGNALTARKSAAATASPANVRNCWIGSKSSAAASAPAENSLKREIEYAFDLESLSRRGCEAA